MLVKFIFFGEIKSIELATVLVEPRLSDPTYLDYSLIGTHVWEPIDSHKVTHLSRNSGIQLVGL